MTAIVWVAALFASACGQATPSSSPSPSVIDTAEAASRAISIPAEYSTTPTADDENRKEPVVLSGRVFGHGETGVILAHMRPADQSSWFPFATRLAATGNYTVLTFDFRGYNESTGEKEFDRVDTDLAAVLRHMRGELGVARVFRVGASMGGTAALLVAGREDVDGVISISSLARYQQLDALTAVPLIRSPKLFITSADDVPAALSEEQFWAQAVGPKEHKVFEGNAHGTDLFASAAAREFEQVMLDFIARH
jgi:pimeloyl-ACP methyl ester carboxylesterase